MAISLPNAESIVDAWLAATSHLEEHRSVFDLVFTAQKPQLLRASDVQVIKVHDRFLRTHDSSVTTVANTIFPGRIYKKYGYPEFFQHANGVQNRLKSPGAWGSYFQRLSHGKSSGEIPLSVIVTKMKKQLAKERGAYSNVYEWSAPLYDPTLDCNRTRPQPCMSHISFKLVNKTLLRISAMYRSHYYISKLLGNLIGLRDLQAFICKEVGLESGPLTIFSSFAEFDADKWTVQEARQMLHECRSARDNVLNEVSEPFVQN